MKNTPFSLTAGGDNRYTLERLKPERRVLFHAQADYRCGFAAGGGAVYPAGLQQTHPLPEPDNNRQSTATGEGIADALDAIYFDVSIMGVQDATAERLASDFGVDTSCLSAVYGRYTDGRFGIADVILVVPKPGQEASARDLLVTIRTSRASLFANYDIYGASELAENGVIYTLGDYYVLLMINDTDHVRELLEQYIPT